MPIHSEHITAMRIPCYTTDPVGLLTFYNEAAASFWGQRPEIGVSSWCGSWRLYQVDGTPLLHKDSPLALMLQQGKPVPDIEIISERPDGVRVAFLSYPSLLRDEYDTVTGAINVLVDLGDRNQGYLQQERLAAIVSSSDDIIISKTLDGIITSWNAGATRILGFTEAEMIGLPITTIIPSELAHEETEIIRKIRSGERIEHFDTQRLAKDGRRVDLSLTVSPLRNRLGQIVGASKVARDVTERKRTEELQRLLLNELNHRVKNTLATVQAIASQSLRSYSSPNSFVASFNGRLRALAKAHDLLVRGQMKAVSIGDLFDEQVLLLQTDARITHSGPPVRLNPNATIQLALLLHELATNARKFGALSIPHGTLDVTWRVVQGTTPQLIIDWREGGLQDLRSPTSTGFGTSLIGQSLAGAGGTAELKFLPKGVFCQIRLSLGDKDDSGLSVPADEAGEDPATGADSQEYANLRGRTILLVEDEPLIAMDVVDLLTTEGMVVIGPGRTLEQAQELTRAGGYDVALLDANLNGHPVDAIADMLAQTSVRFGFCTGYGREGLPAGHQERPILAKPFGRAELLGMVNDLLGTGS